MADIAYAQQKIAPEDYLAAENESVTRHEFIDGAIYAMTGASDRHNMLALTIAGRLQDHLPNRCQVFMSDMRLRIRNQGATFYYYPDVFVSCAAGDRASHHREQPVLIIEVLSPTTDRIDRAEKFRAYTAIPSLIEYVLADPALPHVEVYRRRTGWTREDFGAGAQVGLESVELDVAVDGLYRRLMG